MILVFCCQLSLFLLLLLTYSTDIEIELIANEIEAPNLVTITYTPLKACQAMMHVTVHGEQISGGPFFLDIEPGWLLLGVVC